MPDDPDAARDALAHLRRAADDGRLAVVCDRFGIDLLGAFGSAVRQADAPAADLDVAILFSHEVRGNLLGVVAALIDLLGYERLDVMDLAAAGVVARSRALGPGAVPLYERHPGSAARAQMAALTTEMETEHLRRLDLELLAGR